MNHQIGLYKIELNENGVWGPPILLSEYVTQMDVSFIYATALNSENEPIGCPSAFNDDIFQDEHENLTDEEKIEILNQKFNNYDIHEKANATFNATQEPSNPKGSQGEDLTKTLEEPKRYLPPLGINIILTLTLPTMSKTFGLGKNNNDHSSESIKMNIASGENINSKSFRIFSSIRGGNQCANRNLLD